MSLATLLDRAAARAERGVERPLQQVDAVYDDELWGILEHYGLLASLDRGELHCHLTGVLLNRQNVGGLIGTVTGPKPIVDAYAEALDVR